MRVLMISQDFYPLKGGIATYLLQIYKTYFSKEIFQVLTLKNMYKTHSNSFNFKIKKLNFFPFIFPTKRKEKNKAFLNNLIDFKPDLILFGYIRSHPEIIEECKKLNPNVKYGVVLHAKEAFFDTAIKKRTNYNGIQKGYTPKEIIEYKDILKSADFLICVSNFTKRLIKKQGIKNKKIFVIYPTLEEISSSPKYLKIEKYFTLLSVGRLIKRKGQDLVIKSLINLKKIVNFNGEVNKKELNRIYSNCNIFVLPTKFIKPNDIEGFGIVFIEANSFSKPVIGGKTGGVIEAIENGKSGFLINPNSKKELINKIILLYKNRKILNKIGKYGRKRVIHKFYRKKNMKFVEFLKDVYKIQKKSST